jgi:hypothetical protein
MSEENIFWIKEGMAKELSASEKELRDKFVEQYIFDFDRVAAALRIGFLPSFALEWSQKFLDEPYVRLKIAEALKAKAEDEAVEDAETKRRIRASLLREANYRGAGSSHAARVGALSKLSSLYGMDAPIKTNQEITHRGGVMAVPGIADASAWEDAAQASQTKLRTDSEV